MIESIQPFLSVSEFAKLANVSKMSVYRLIDSGELRAVKIRSQWRINRSSAYELLNISE